MGATYYSYVLVGLEIDEDSLRIYKQVRNCKCKVEGIEDMEFCPKCGKRAFFTDYDLVSGFNEDEDKFLDFDIIHNTDDRNCWLAIRSKEVGDDRGMFDAVKLELPDDLSELREAMKIKLGPIKLWDEKKFGVWAVQCCRY